MEYGEYLILASTLIGVGGVVATVMYARFRMQLLSKITFAMLAVVIVVVLVGFTLGKLGVTLMTMGISTFIGVGTLVIAISALNKSIARPLDRLIAVMDEVSRGNLDLEIDIQRRDDDLGELARSFRKMKESVAALLKEQEEATHFFEGTINSIADMVVTTDSEFRVNMVNPALEKLLGFREEEVVGKPVAELSFLPRERTANLGDILAELGRVGIRTSESELRHKDGGMIPFLTSMATMRDADGNALGMVVIAKDITEIKSLMRQQEEAARFFGGTINSIADMVVTTDSEFRVNMVNPALEKLLGFREEEVVGKPVAELPFFSKERASNLGDTLAELSRVGIRTTESELRRKDGRMIPFLTSMATMRDADGNVLGMVVVGKDITEIKNLMRQQEEQREYLERSAKQISAAMQEIAEGNLEIGLQKERDDEIGTIIDSIHGTVDEVKALVADVHTLAEAGVAGRLDARADASRHHGDFRKIVQGLNDTLDAIVGPFSATAEYVGRISRGDIPEPILDEYQGDFNEIKNNLNELISSLDKVTAVTTQIAAGDLAVEVRLRSERDELMKSLSEMATYLQEMADAAGRIAQGDLQVEVTPKSKKDILGSAFSQMITGLNATISQTNGVVEQVVPSVEQIRAISQSLASSAEEQSAAAEEVASSLEQTDAQVRSNAESANVANQLVSQASDVANAGQEKMKSMTKAMDGIAEASREIARIIKVIDEIAFQTNLLALNAAVEAARAGQHGRGFAVVAQEVRNLAGRSAKAARETAELIEDAGHRVEEGVGIADETAGALGEIVQNVLKVRDLVAEIAAASEDQAGGVTQISTAMVQVNEGAQAGSQQSEELASTADELGQLVSRLRQETARFQLREQWGCGREIAGMGMTPEMLQRVAKLVRAQAATSGDGGPAMAEPQAVERGNDGLELALDRDERGYGEF